MKFSLWIEPPASVADKYLAIIDGLAIRYKAEFFDPHLTLYTPLVGGEEEIVDAARALASCIDPIEIHLDSLEHTEDFYRALYISALETSTWNSAHKHADKLLHSFAPDGPRIADPHMSLLYAHMPDEEKQGIIHVLGDKFSDTFTCHTLSLWQTEDKVESWQRIASFDLKDSA